MKGFLSVLKFIVIGIMLFIIVLAFADTCIINMGN